MDNDIKEYIYKNTRYIDRSITASMWFITSIICVCSGLIFGINNQVELAMVMVVYAGVAFVWYSVLSIINLIVSRKIKIK